MSCVYTVIIIIMIVVSFVVMARPRPRPIPIVIVGGQFNVAKKRRPQQTAEIENASLGAATAAADRHGSMKWKRSCAIPPLRHRPSIFGQA